MPYKEKNILKIHKSELFMLKLPPKENVLLNNQCFAKIFTTLKINT